MTEHDCPICRLLRDRIEYLEERLERAEQAAEQGILHAPFEWALNRQQEVVARCLARGPVTVDGLLAALEHDRPSQDGRSRKLVRVLMHGLRQRIRDYGWIILPANRAPVGAYRLLPEQQGAFRAALRADGDHAYPSITSRSKAA
ncbi:hypothetical protein [Maricaulis sp.]|uniref:hypothetical protein n=1 Tax=Maricaulis sp. TaxID=1486257 RepID=UPI000C3D6398|nr:hypothetical protein [Maricaulis sp.]MAC89671.1 hypothetical protein [Maricaulis sp.]